MWLLPPDYVVLDIETIGGDPSDAEAWMRRAWTPAANWKPETIGNRWVEAHSKKLERLALIDGSPIVSVSMKSPTGCFCVHHLNCDESVLAGAAVKRVGGERDMLLALREIMNSAGPDTTLVGHNVRRFDLPRLRRAYLKHGLQLPACLASLDHPLYDTMDKWSRFSQDERQFISLEECLQATGIPNHKTAVSGEDVARLYQSGEHQTLLTYAVVDVLVEEALFLRMTGQASDAA